MISVIAPVFNESESLEELIRRVRDAFIGTDEEYQ
jgi:glycosyltransferase involved in cell wall biosynthesis